MKCPFCNSDVFALSQDGERLKANTSMLVLHKATNEVEINCATCKNGILLPLMVTGSELRKGRTYRPVVFARRDLTSAPKSDQ